MLLEMVCFLDITESCEHYTNKRVFVGEFMLRGLNAIILVLIMAFSCLSGCIGTDEIEITEDGDLSFYVNYTSIGCYNNNVSIHFFSKKAKPKISNLYVGPEINILIISRELDKILYRKSCWYLSVIFDQYGRSVAYTRYYLKKTFFNK